MFKISTKGDYGLLLLSAIAARQRDHQDGKKFISLKEIAKSKHLSLPYLSQIVTPLKEAGLLVSKEGRDGGYALTREPHEITMMEILEVLEGPVSPVRCCNDAKTKCGSEEYCNVKSSWQEAKIMLKKFLSTRTLADTMPSRSLANKLTHPKGATF